MAQAWARERKNVKGLEDEYNQDFELFREQEKEFIDLKTRFFASSSYNLAQLLEEGKPCPVCGSIHHPDKAHATNPVSEADYKKAEKKYGDSTNNLSSKKNTLDSSKAALEAKENTLVETLKKNGFADANK